MAISSMMLQTNVIASSLLDLGSADVPVQREFEFTIDQPIYRAPGRIVFKHNEIVREDLDGMLNAGVVPPAVSTWSFTKVIATRKDVKPSFCEDYRTPI